MTWSAPMKRTIAALLVLHTPVTSAPYALGDLDGEGADASRGTDDEYRQRPPPRWRPMPKRLASSGSGNARSAVMDSLRQRMKRNFDRLHPRWWRLLPDADATSAHIRHRRVSGSTRRTHLAPPWLRFPLTSMWLQP